MVDDYKRLVYSGQSKIHTITEQVIACRTRECEIVTPWEARSMGPGFSEGGKAVPSDSTTCVVFSLCSWRTPPTHPSPL